MGQQTNLVTDNIYKLLRKISIPAILGLFFLTIYNLVDTYFAGKISSDALAGIALVFPLFQMISAISSGTTSGIGAILGNALGADNKKYATQVVYNGLVISIVLSLIIMIIGFVISPFVIHLLTQTKETQVNALVYIDIMFLGTLTFVLPGYLNALLVATGNSSIYRNVLLVGMIANLILDFLFILIFHWGMYGIAGSTILIQFFQMIYLFYALKKIPFLKDIKFITTKYFSYSLCLELVKNSLIPAVNMLLMAFGILIYNYYIGLTGGDEALAGFGIGYKIEQILIIPVSGIGIAALSIMAQNNGIANYQRIRETFKKSLYVSIIILLIGELILFITKYPLMHLFTNDTQAIKYGIQYILVELFIIPFYAILTIATSTLQSLKKPTMNFIITLVRQIILPVGVFTILLQFYKLSTLGVYIGVGIINVVVLTIVFIITYWMIKKRI